MPNDLVLWRELRSVFRSQFPHTTDEVITSETTARVEYNGSIYEIRPIFAPAIMRDPVTRKVETVNVGRDIEVWGPAYAHAMTGAY